MTIPVLSLLDEKWCTYTEDFVRRMADGDQPWFCYLGTRGAHFDNYPHDRFLGTSPAKHPYKDTIIELDDIVGRLVRVLEETGQADDTIIFLSSDNGPHMENWPDAAYTPFRCAKGSTWEGGVRVPGIAVWPGMIEADRPSDGLFCFTDLLPTMLGLAGAEDRIPDDRFIDGVDQASFLLGERASRTASTSGTGCCRRCRPCAAASTSSCSPRPATTTPTPGGPGGFTGVTQNYTYARTVQPLPGPQGAAQLHDPQDRLQRGLPVGHRPAPPHATGTSPPRRSSDGQSRRVGVADPGEDVPDQHPAPPATAANASPTAVSSKISRVTTNMTSVIGGEEEGHPDDL